MKNEEYKSIQEKIHAEKLKIQEKLDKNKEKPINFEEIKPKKFEETRKKIKEQVEYKGNSSLSNVGAIFNGIMIMIVGFSILTIGNYLLNSIISSSSVIYGDTSGVISYLNSLFPLIGMLLMVFGFATILFSLRYTFDSS